MRHGMWWVGLLAVVATLLTTGKAWVDENNEKDGGVRGDLERLHREVADMRQAVSDFIRRQGGRERTPASETAELTLRVRALERDVADLRAEVGERRREERVVQARVAVEPDTLTVLPARVPRYYYVYPSCGYYNYYYPATWYYSYPTYYSYYYPTYTWWGW